MSSYIFDPCLLIATDNEVSETVRRETILEYLDILRGGDHTIVFNRDFYTLFIPDNMPVELREFLYKAMNNGPKCYIPEDYENQEIHECTQDDVNLLFPEEEYEVERYFLGCFILTAFRLLSNQDDDDLIILSYDQPTKDYFLNGCENHHVAFKFWRIRFFIENDLLFIPIIRCSRNWEIRWTSRYDIRLPSYTDNDNGIYPFTPPDNWMQLEDNHVVGISFGLCGWIDQEGRIWCPAYFGNSFVHWDVEIKIRNRAPTHINVTPFGGNKEPGILDHGNVIPQFIRGWRQ